MIERLLEYAAWYLIAWCLIIFTILGAVVVYNFIEWVSP